MLYRISAPTECLLSNQLQSNIISNTFFCIVYSIVQSVLYNAYSTLVVCEYVLKVARLHVMSMQGNIIHAAMLSR